MPLMVSHRSFTLSSTLGHTVAFEKGVPTLVPYLLVEEATAKGVLMHEGEAPDVTGVEKPAEVRVLHGEEREQAIHAAVQQLLDTNNRADFTATGLPRHESVAAIVRTKVASAEIAKAVDRINTAKAAQ